MQQSNKKFESHASWIVNNRLNVMFALVDTLGPRAWMTMKVSDIQTYFFNVKQIFVNVKDVLDTAEDADKHRLKFEQLLGLINKGPEYRSMATLQEMLRQTDEMYSQIVTGLQSWGYFFRVGSYQKKGLKHINFAQTIFGGGDNDGTTEPDEGADAPEESS